GLLTLPRRSSFDDTEVRRSARCSPRFRRALERVRRAYRPRRARGRHPRLTSRKLFRRVALNAQRPSLSNDGARVRVLLGRRIAAFALLFLSAACACAVPRRPIELPPASQGYVAVLSGEMPVPISQVARHAWIVA